ncbi:VanZ family protein [Actinoalloteichus hymeniacidonis]|uniref:VanZ like family protein n=1 Tax=Actinoalloteichus hymeniacidonis TaxID=340345 RepID=A0AAC9HS32_9PSEU|nr:VanZ family protein [Actinoalloteichus hymeniacidonis]AOS64373.1 VanZ like family protein [Actinoalloteichus hymeniacidonis]MBB5907559.1 VanZ family protein [Actinoalloteichus hymeniacidonis]
MSPRWTPFLLALLTSIVVFFMPASGVPSAPPGTDKVVHAAVFAALTVTGLWTTISRLLLAIALACYACLTEVLQANLPLGRSGDPGDVVADLVGVGIAWSMCWLFGRYAARRRASAERVG